MKKWIKSEDITWDQVTGKGKWIGGFISATNKDGQQEWIGEILPEGEKSKDSIEIIIPNN